MKITQNERSEHDQIVLPWASMLRWGGVCNNTSNKTWVIFCCLCYKSLYMLYRRCTFACDIRLREKRNMISKEVAFQETQTESSSTKCSNLYYLVFNCFSNIDLLQKGRDWILLNFFAIFPKWKCWDIYIERMWCLFLIFQNITYSYP